jgi:hypothetical protein
VGAGGAQRHPAAKRRQRKVVADVRPHGQSHELHPRAGQQRVFAGDATQQLDSSSDSGLVQALTAGSPGKAEFIREASQAAGIHAIARMLVR